MWWKNNFLFSDSSREVIPKGQGEKKTSEQEALTKAQARENKEAAPPSGEETHNRPSETQLVKSLLVQILI